MRTLTRLTVYRQAVFAILLPILLVLGYATGALSQWCGVLASQSPTKRLLIAMGIAMFILEAAYLPTLVLLVRARGSVVDFNARRAQPARVARIRRRRFGAVVAGLTTIVTLLVVEVIFRLFDIRAHDPPPYGRSVLRHSDDTLNALGLREDWKDIADDDPRIRIAFLGDSITYGDGVEAHETFCHLLEGMLSHETPEGVITINMAQSATGPGHQLRELYLPLHDRLRPDVVVHVVYVNDMGIESRRSLLDIYRIRDDQLWVGEVSYLLSYAERQIRYGMAWNRTIDYYRGGRSAEERAKTWGKFKADMRATKQAVEDSGAVYAVVMFPWLNRLEDYLLGDLHENMREFAAELDVPYFDLLKVFTGRHDEALRVGLVDEHPNAAAHKITAEAIARFLREEILPGLPQ